MKTSHMRSLLNVGVSSLSESSKHESENIMPHRLSIFIEQMTTLKSMVIGAICSALAAADTPIAVVLNPFSQDALSGNSSFLTMVAGALGGALLSTRNQTIAASNIAQWSWRIFLSTTCSIIFTPIFLNVACQVNLTVSGIPLKLTPNAAVVLSASAAVAIGWKEVIRLGQSWLFRDKGQDK